LQNQNNNNKQKYFLVEHSGPAIIKLAQWAATRRDLFSLNFCQRLSRLQRKTCNRSFHLTEQILCDTFGSNWKQLFQSFEKEPIGSGCIAQVERFCIFLFFNYQFFQVYKAEINPSEFHKNTNSVNTNLFHNIERLSVAVKVILFCTNLCLHLFCNLRLRILPFYMKLKSIYPYLKHLHGY
jgi:hypothetical protein